MPARGLHSGAALLLSGLGAPILAACSDPPPPAARAHGPSNGATAPHVAWALPSGPIDRPHAVLLDTPGGPLDRLAADADVTTFLNDRFHAWFVPVATGPRTLFLATDGCLLTPPVDATSRDAWIDAANAAALANADGARHGRPSLPAVPGVPRSHPLADPCSAAP
jgi:hypothetical protein